MEQPAALDGASVDLLMTAFLAAVGDKVHELLVDDSTTNTVMAGAPRSVAVTATTSGKLNYLFTVSIPLSVLTAAGAPAARRLGDGARRRLQGGSSQDYLAALLTDGTLTQKLLESGVGNAQDLIDSGALGVSAAAVEPSPSPSATPHWGASGAVLLGGLPASAFDAAGMLTASAVGSIESALSVGIASACAACTVRVSRVENSATGAVVFAGGRRLAAATYTVAFFVGGAGAAAAAAGIDTAAVAAQLSTALGAPITVAAAGGGAAAAPSGLSPGGAAGVALAIILLSAAAVVLYFRAKKGAMAAAKVASMAEAVPPPNGSPPTGRAPAASGATV